MTGKWKKTWLGLGLAGAFSAMSVSAVFAQEAAETVSESETGSDSLNTALIECDDEDISGQIQATLAYSSEGFLDTITQYSEEEVTDMAENGSDFEKAIASAWEENREELGTLLSVKHHEISESNGIYTVITTAQFENKDADITVTYDTDLQPAEATIDTEKTLAENMMEAGLNFIIGMCTVFIVLIFLTFVIGLLKPLSEKIEGRKKKEEETQIHPPVAPVIEAEEQEELTDDLELVAVITAAIAASENTSSDGFVVRSIKRAKNRKW